MNSTNWLFACPAPAAGQIAPGFYNAGSMMADDRSGPTEEDSRMQIVSGIRDRDFEDFLSLVLASGGRVYARHAIGQSRFFTFSLGDKHYHVRFFPQRQELRVSEDCPKNALEGFGYSGKGEADPLVCQYGLYYDPYNRVTETAVNCGMLYVIRLSDGSLFMIDGGILRQWREDAMDALWDFLCRITGAGKTGTVRIAGWYFTHTHDDHIDGCIKLLNRHHDRIRLERFLFNFPHYPNVAGYSDSAIRVREVAQKHYPDLQVLKLHTGHCFSLCDMKVEVFYTHEDGVEKEDITRFPMIDTNCQSTILKLTLGGRSLMLLGDTNVETEDLLARYPDPAPWKSDMVQLAHHCFNYLDTLYSWIEAPVILVPNSYGGAHQPENWQKLLTPEKYLKDGQIYYEGAGTDVLTPTREGWKLTAHYPLTGGEYDFSGY